MKFDYDIVIKIVKELEIFEILSRKCECVCFRIVFLLASVFNSFLHNVGKRFLYVIEANLNRFTFRSVTTLKRK